MNTIRLNEKKYENALLYFMSYCNNVWLGKTKLNKLMYYLDFISYRDRGKSVSQDIYQHKDFGPVPKSIDDVLLALKKNNKMVAEDVPYMSASKKVFYPKAEPDMAAFDEYEKKLLDTICSKFRSWPTKKIVEQTHFESPWLYSEPYEVVDYDYAHDIEIIPDDELAEFADPSSTGRVHAGV